MKSAYLVFCDAINGNPTWDTFIGAFESFESAKDAADTDWQYTTKSERKNRTTYVAKIEIPDDADIEDALDYDDGSGYSVEYTAED